MTKHRRFSSGRLVCNVDASNDNLFLTSSELGLCGRPLQLDADLTLPLSKEMILPESLDVEADLKQAERQRPSNEACAAQKGTRRWEALLQSLLIVNGESLKGKPCIVVNFTPYIEDVFKMRLANQELKGGFKTDMLFYHSVQWIVKDSFGHARLTREVTDSWVQRKFEHGGHYFSNEVPELSEKEIDSIPGARASLGNLDSMTFEVLERMGNRMMIKSDEHRFWSSQTGGILTEYEALRHQHLDLVGQSPTVAAAAASEQPNAASAGSGSSDAGVSESPPATTELESVSKLQETVGIEVRVASECSHVELILGSDKSVWLVSDQQKTIGKHCVLGGYGTGQWVPEAECSEPGVPFAMKSDQSLVQIDEGSFAAEAQGFQTLTLYKLLLRAENEKNLTEHRFSFLQIQRKSSVEAGEDGFDVSLKGAMTFRCLRDPRAFGAQGRVDEKVTSKNFFSKCLGPTLPKEAAQTVFRYRFERVGQNFKIQRPYVITSHSLTLQKEKPLKLV
ncbi:Uncharacterized protein SCF082_LOCUS40699 [Durusdinium trenchii]|uniref:Uncharacterized protein n=1 Tax=Durusdinium trenchii TaxID=1381693 RepID=A0ABP0QDN5_9DINO